ncbi:MAG: T9SS type A sorting domain-containing protein [Bacteroidetes bacterium]|nr:T9SS type A sorting domain-containing protein [Bacteroidota bacterium]
MKIQIHLILVLLILHTLGISAQNNPATPTVHFSYDANGNRFQRWVTIEKIAKVDSADSLHQDTIIKSFNRNAGNNMDQNISLYPNPTQGLLDLRITDMQEGKTAEFVFVSLTGQELLRKKTALSVTNIDISNFPPGSYIFTITLDKRMETWKVIKQ